MKDKTPLIEALEKAGVDFVIHNLGPEPPYQRTTFNFQVDPNNQYRDATRDELIDACGLIPGWLQQDDERSALEQLKAHYPFYHGGLSGKVGFKTGVYIYPGDPVLHPYMAINVRDEIVFIYPYAIVAIVEVDEEGNYITKHATRMD